MSTTLYLVPEPEERTAYGLLETVLADDVALWGRFEAACVAGVGELRETVLDFRAALLEAGHVFDSYENQHEETFFALLELAGDYLPDSPGAIRARLRERVRESVTPRPGGGMKIIGAVDCRRAVEIAMAYEDAMFDEVVVFCSSHARLYAVAARVRDRLAGIGRSYPAGDVEDGLLVLVRDMAPGSPAAGDETRNGGTDD